MGRTIIDIQDIIDYKKCWIKFMNYLEILQMATPQQEGTFTLTDIMKKIEKENQIKN